MKNTKQDILKVALDMFSKRGYSAVSIRDICKEVGIKESTVYYHFKNKQEIIETLLCEFRDITGSVQNTFSRELSKTKWIEEQPFIAVGLSFLNDYLLKEQILKFLRMLMIEQHFNIEAEELYHHVLFSAPLKQNAAVFKALIEMGCFKNYDVNCLALEYYAPIFFVFQQYFSSGEVTEENRAAANETLRVHFYNFYRRYCNLQI